MPGIRHVMARSIKDIFCRFKTLKDTRLSVRQRLGHTWSSCGIGCRKELGITKEDIGKKITIDRHNATCKKAVMKYTDVWNDLAKKWDIGWIWEDPYVTYHSKYMESRLVAYFELYKKDLLYKEYTIQPYSPKAGTGLSSHEINQPGCYRDVKDTSL